MHYMVKGIPGLEGLVVDGEYRERVGAGTSDHIAVDEIINPNVVVGDRTVKFPMPKGAIYINDQFLVPVGDYRERQFSTKSPFGKFLFEGHLKRGELVVDYVQYDNAVSVTIREDKGKVGRTVYTQNFFADGGSAAMKAIAAVLSDEKDVDDLVFRLKELKQEELKGTTEEA